MVLKKVHQFNLTHNLTYSWAHSLAIVVLAVVSLGVQPCLAKANSNFDYCGKLKPQEFFLPSYEFVLTDANQNPLDIPPEALDTIQVSSDITLYKRVEHNGEWAVVPRSIPIQMFYDSTKKVFISEGLKELPLELVDKGFFKECWERVMEVSYRFRVEYQGQVYAVVLRPNIFKTNPTRKEVLNLLNLPQVPLQVSLKEPNLLIYEEMRAP